MPCVGVRRLVQLSLTREDMFSHHCGEFGDEGMTLLNSCLGVKELACLCFRILSQTTQLCRFLALQAQVECLGICWWGLGLKVPILFNWVRFRPGICDSGATLSTGSWTCDKSPTQGCLGLAPMSWSKQWGIDIFPIFLLRLGSNLWMSMASFASLVIERGLCQLC